MQANMDRIPYLLTPEEMGRADELTIYAGTPGSVLMERAGGKVAAAAQQMVPDGGHILILCGPGNNGGDGFVAARQLDGAGFDVSVLLLCDPARLKGDAAQAFQNMQLPWSQLTEESLSLGLGKAGLVIDALFGAGLDRALEGMALKAVKMLRASKTPVLAVDLPSGLNGATGAALGAVFEAVRTVTFYRRKPGHLLEPGRSYCGIVEVVDIGIRDDVLKDINPKTFANEPFLWAAVFPVPGRRAHKYSRGHALVFGGQLQTTGASRLSAMAALRAGSGLVTMAVPPGALSTYAAHLTAIMVRPLKGEDALARALSDDRLSGCLIGPGYGTGSKTSVDVVSVLAQGRATVLDADALTCFEADTQRLFQAISACNTAGWAENAGATPKPAKVVLTPHEGEFKRLFPDLNVNNRLTAARQAAQASGAVVVLKGPDTVIAAPDGRAAINGNAPPWLATAGSGDVLAGLITGFLAQSVPAFEAAAMGVWCHGEAGSIAGAGLIAEDLPAAVQPVIAGLVAERAG